MRVYRDEGQFEAVIPPRANQAEIKHYALEQAAKRFGSFLVPSLVPIIIICLVYGWDLLGWSLAAVVLVALPISIWIQRDVIEVLQPLRVGWAVESNGDEFWVYREDQDGREQAKHATLRDLNGMRSTRIEDDVLFDYVHDQFSNELQFTSARGSVLFAEGLDYETCEEIVAEFDRFVDRLRSEKAAAAMPGVPGLD